MSPLELDRLEFYRIEYTMKEYEEYVKRENEEYERQQKDAERKYRVSSPSSVNYGGSQIPKVSIPKFEMPKMNK